ncbi:hypothetical protein ACF06P_38430 [Streptomyces sp. NPDC015684]|uniref:hypothetical protein n=1 Tax=Streptomyces sp. NPDC015684 TaxID=3364963 RepID=UPI0036F6E4E5
MLRLKPDGTSTADRVCGDYDIDAIRAEERAPVGIGHRDGRRLGGTDQHHGLYDPGDVDCGYQALREGTTSKLWACGGDPDDGGHCLCVLTQQHG